MSPEVIGAYALLVASYLYLGWRIDRLALSEADELDKRVAALEKKAEGQHKTNTLLVKQSNDNKSAVQNASFAVLQHSHALRVQGESINTLMNSMGGKK